MIVIQVELWPKGFKTRKRLIGTLVITNDGTGTAEFGNYTWALSHAGKFLGVRKEPYKTGKLVGFPRHLSPYRLISRVLKLAKEV